MKDCEKELRVDKKLIRTCPSFALEQQHKILIQKFGVHNDTKDIELLRLRN